jgi:hypothetical protein
MNDTNHRTTGLVETDMATLAAAEKALEDLEGLLLALPYQRRTTPEDIMRLDSGLQRLGAGLGVVRKFLRHLRRNGWEIADE